MDVDMGMSTARCGAFNARVYACLPDQMVHIVNFTDLRVLTVEINRRRGHSCPLSVLLLAQHPVRSQE